MAFKAIKATDIKESLEGVTRQYLAGTLSRPQGLRHVENSEVEIGITEYREAATESPHRHQRAKEYQYVLSGMTEYWEVETNEIHRFVAGDFYVIYPGTTYAQRSKMDTRILFIKFPAGNDKVPTDPDTELSEWLKVPLRAERIDARKGAAALKANSLRRAVAVGILNQEVYCCCVPNSIGKRDAGRGCWNWTRTLLRAPKREVAEETELSISVEGLLVPIRA